MEGVSSEISTILLEKNCFRCPSLLNMATRVLKITLWDPLDVSKENSKQEIWYEALQAAPREIREGGYENSTIALF